MARTSVLPWQNLDAGRIYSARADLDDKVPANAGVCGADPDPELAKRLRVR